MPAAFSSALTPAGAAYAGDASAEAANAAAARTTTGRDNPLNIEKLPSAS
jgi:hypothetical protein